MLFHYLATRLKQTLPAKNINRNMCQMVFAAKEQDREIHVNEAPKMVALRQLSLEPNTPMHRAAKWVEENQSKY